MNPWVAFNTAVSFATNTNWQVYVPETAVSYLTQMLALARENFVSAAIGMAVAVAFIRGLTRHSTRELGNFWVDFTRSFLYILLPHLHRRRAVPRVAGRRAEPQRRPRTP